MFEQQRWSLEAWIPVTTGLLWLWCAASFGAVGFLFSLVPGCLLLTGGVSTLLYPGDSRIPQFVAAGGLLGVPLALPAFIVAGVPTGLALMALSATSFLAAGAIAVRQEPHTTDVPEPAPSVRLALQVAVDEAILSGLTLRTTLAIDPDAVRAEVHAARELFDERGWLNDPASYHLAPPPLERVDSMARHAVGVDFEHFRFASGYEPHADEPGRDRWLSYTPTQTAHAWILRHVGPPRPWLLCIHGYEMGMAPLDLLAFRAKELHRRLGVNLAINVLPLHGPRRIGRSSGSGFLAGNFLDTIHAEAQAMWDLRRLLSWIQSQTDQAIGLFGLSLGGYNASLLAGLADGLACVVAGIPATDFSRLTWRHGPALQLRYAERHGLVHDEVAEVLRVVSPLALAPRVAHERLAIFAGVADRLVPPDQPRDLWQHWGRPAIHWYQGAHVTFRAHPPVRALLEKTLRDAGVVWNT